MLEAKEMVGDLEEKMGIRLCEFRPPGWPFPNSRCSSNLYVLDVSGQTKLKSTVIYLG